MENLIPVLFVLFAFVATIRNAIRKQQGKDNRSGPPARPQQGRMEAQRRPAETYQPPVQPELAPWQRQPETTTVAQGPWMKPQVRRKAKPAAKADAPVQTSAPRANGKQPLSAVSQPIPGVRVDAAREDWQRALVLAEILGPPKAKQRPQH